MELPLLRPTSLGSTTLCEILQSENISTNLGDFVGPFCWSGETGDANGLYELGEILRQLKTSELAQKERKVRIG